MILRIFLCLMLLATMLLGAEFWDEKPPSEWTDQEIDLLLEDSPWAITKTIARGAILGPQRITPRRRVRIGNSPKTITFTVRWLSAEPVREAFKRQIAMQGRGGNQIRQIEKMLGQAGTHYMVVVTDVPSSIIQQTNATEPQLKRGAMLKVKDRFETAPSRVEMRRGGGGAQIVFYFPRTDSISIEDKKIEFQMKIGATTIKREFKPRQMMVDGEMML